VRTLTLAAALVAAALLPASGAAAVSAPSTSTGLGIRLTEAPRDRADDPRAQSYIVDHLQPGQSISRRVEVINGTQEVLRPDFYVGPADIAGGAFAPAEKGAVDDLTSWASVEDARLELAPGERIQTRVTIDVPTDAADGERYGVVWAELPPVEGGGVGQVNRVGVRIYLSVGDGREPGSDFTIDALQAARAESGEPLVRATVTNTGGRALDMSGSLRLSEGPGGLSAGPFAAEVGTTLAPGQSSPVTVLLDEAIDGGPWLATLTLQSGRLDRAAQARIMFPDEAGRAAAPVAAMAVDGDNPWVIAAGGLIGLLALLLLLRWLLRRRRRRGDDQAREVSREGSPVAGG
jgi:hypothetical protein